MAVWATVAERCARADALSDLEKAHNAYVAHRYDDAENRLRALLDARTGTLKDADNVADARMYLGAAYLAQGKKSDAEAVFQQLLREKPDYQPDPLRVSLQATDALIDTRSRMREELAASLAEKVRQAQEEKAKADLERQREALRLAMLEKLASEETVIRSHSRWIAALPFGVGQFQNEQPVLGAAFLTTESLLVVGSAVSQIVMMYNERQANAAARSVSPTQITYQARAVSAYVAANLFAAGFALVAIAGIVHAELTFVPELVEVRRRPLPSVSLLPMVLPLGGAHEQRAGALFGVLGQF